MYATSSFTIVINAREKLCELPLKELEIEPHSFEHPPQGDPSEGQLHEKLFGAVLHFVTFVTQGPCQSSITASV